MCIHCDALDSTDYLISLLNKLLETEFPPAANFKYADEKFKDESMLNKPIKLPGSFNG